MSEAEDAAFDEFYYHMTRELAAPYPDCNGVLLSQSIVNDVRGLLAVEESLRPLDDFSDRSGHRLANP